MSNQTRAVFFDLGGTLFSYQQVARHSIPVLLEGARRLGVDAPSNEVIGAFGAASRNAYAVYGKRPFYLHKDLFLETFRELARLLERDATPEFLEWIYESQRLALVDNMVLRDDCLDTLQSLRDRGLHLSLVSNIDNDHLLPLVSRLGLDRALDDWTSSEDARSCKPDEGFFQLVLSKANCRAEEVMFVGDSREHDIQGARNLGMTAVLISDPGSGLAIGDTREDVQPHHEITNLSELLSLVD